MATVNKDVVVAALHDGVLDKPIRPNQAIYLSSAVVTARSILEFLERSTEPVLADAIAEQCELNRNTVKQYLGIFVENDYADELSAPTDVGRPQKIYQRGSLSNDLVRYREWLEKMLVQFVGDDFQFSAYTLENPLDALLVEFGRERLAVDLFSHGLYRLNQIDDFEDVDHIGTYRHAAMVGEIARISAINRIFDQGMMLKTR